MGAVSFSLDRHLVRALKSELALNILVETGTFKGDTVASVSSEFSRTFTVELSISLWKLAVQRFENHPSIEVILGNSVDALRDLEGTLTNESVFFWLDAHWCVAEGTSGEISQCPLLEEIKAIGPLNDHSVIAIDDARLFLAPPLPPHESTHWPAFYDIMKTLHEINGRHRIMVVNDVIVVFPERLLDCMHNYGRTFGMDWLSAVQSFQTPHYAKSLEEKESVIQGLVRARDAMLAELEQKEGLIRSLSQHLERGTDTATSSDKPKLLTNS